VLQRSFRIAREIVPNVWLATLKIVFVEDRLTNNVGRTFKQCLFLSLLATENLRTFGAVYVDILKVDGRDRSSANISTAP